MHHLILLADEELGATILYLSDDETAQRKPKSSKTHILDVDSPLLVTIVRQGEKYPVGPLLFRL
jgi:hypothetical protein